MKQAGLYVLLSNASTHVHQFRGIPALPFVPHQPCDHGLQVQYTSLHCCTRHNCQTSLTSKLAALTKSSSHGAHLVTWRAKKCLHAHRSPQRAQAPAEALYLYLQQRCDAVQPVGKCADLAANHSQKPLTWVDTALAALCTCPPQPDCIKIAIRPSNA